MVELGDQVILLAAVVVYSTAVEVGSVDTCEMVSEAVVAPETVDPSDEEEYVAMVTEVCSDVDGPGASELRVVCSSVLEAEGFVSSICVAVVNSFEVDKIVVSEVASKLKMKGTDSKTEMSMVAMCKVKFSV